MNVLARGRRAQMARLFLIVSAAAIVAGCGRGADANKGSGIAAADSLPDCVFYTAHELDRGQRFRIRSEIDGPAAIKVCEQAVRDNPGSASAQEHLARAYFADGLKRQDQSTQQKGRDALKKAIQLGSPYATAIGAQLLPPEAERAAAERLLQPLIVQGDPGAMLLQAYLEVVEGGRIRPIAELHRKGVMGQFEAAVGAGGAEILGKWVLGLMKEGACGRLAPMGETTPAPRQSDMNAELFCGELLAIAADGGDAMANMQLGLSHLMAALEYADQRGDTNLWRARMNEEKQAARHRLLAVKASGDTFFPIDPLLARISTIELQQDRASREFWAKFLIGGLALLAAADSGASSGQDENPMDAVARRRRESEAELRCMRAKSYTIHYSNDSTGVGAAERAYAAGC